MAELASWRSPRCPPGRTAKAYPRSGERREAFGLLGETLWVGPIWSFKNILRIFKIFQSLQNCLAIWQILLYSKEDRVHWDPLIDCPDQIEEHLRTAWRSPRVEGRGQESPVQIRCRSFLGNPFLSNASWVTLEAEVWPLKWSFFWCSLGRLDCNCLLRMVIKKRWTSEWRDEL